MENHRVLLLLPRLLSRRASDGLPRSHGHRRSVSSLSLSRSLVPLSIPLLTRSLLSRAVSSKHYWTYAGKLRDGWIGGLQVVSLAIRASLSVGCRISQHSQKEMSLTDNTLTRRLLPQPLSQDVSDHQYYLFRSKLPLLVALMLFHVALSRTYRFLSRRLSPTLNPLNPRVYSPSNARDARARFSATFSLILLAALHGTSLPKILVILYLNYRIARLGTINNSSNDQYGLSSSSRRRSKNKSSGAGWSWRREWTPYATWGFNIAVLFANSLAEGYYYSSISPRLAFLVRCVLHNLTPSGVRVN
jgi:hypothetical protein